MDGTKRKKTPAAPSRPVVVDFGTTPPYALPSVFYEESALRSTQWPPLTVNPNNVPHQLGVIDQVRSTQWTALNQNHSPKAQPAPRTRRRIGKRNPDPDIPRIAVENDYDGERHVDTDNDGVYMMNCATGSWSGPLPADFEPEAQAKLPWQAELALQHLKHAQEAAERCQQEELTEIVTQAQQHIESPSSPASSTGSTALEVGAIWQRDLLLRNVIRQIKQRLQQGCILALERMGSPNESVTCVHPCCPASNRLIPAGAYYVLLRPPRRFDNASRYCLFCLEGLWNGQRMTGALPDPRVEGEQAKGLVPSFALDGAMEEARLRAAGIDPTTVTPSSSTASPSAFTNSYSSPAEKPATQYSSPRAPAMSSPATSSSETIVAEPASPLARKSAVLSSFTTETDKAPSEPIEPLVRKLKKTTTKSLKIDTTHHRPMRRSARLQSLSATEDTIPSAVSPDNSDCTFSPQSKTDVLADEIRKTDARLKTIYEQRAKVVKCLEPGQTRWVKQSHAPNFTENYKAVRMDDFGIVHSDLLTDHVKYRMKPPCAELTRGPRAIEGSGSKRVSHSRRTTTPVKDKRMPEHWCSCRGIEDGREMIECSNEKCLVGWYHVECMDAIVHDAEPWLCPVCECLQPRTSSKPIFSADDRKLFDALCSEPYTRCSAYGLQNIFRQIQPRVCATDSTDIVDLLRQLDGNSDAPSLPHQPPKPSPLKQTFSSGPESLLASMHANESTPVNDAKARTPTPSPPETPGLSPPDSTTTGGEWRHPLTRFQHLAEFVRPGNTLDEKEKAAVELWKMASVEQMQWDEFRASHELVVRELDTSHDEQEVEGEEPSIAQNEGTDLREGEKGDDRSEQRNISATQRNEKEEEDEDCDREERLATKAGLTRHACRGKDLSVVLAEIRSRDGK